MPPSPDVDISSGITIVFGTSAFTAEITDVAGPTASRDSVEVTHQGTLLGRDFVPTDLPDYGEISWDIHFNPDDDPPVNLAVEVITVTWPSGATWVFDGFVTSYEHGAPLLDKMTGSITVKISGVIVVTPAA